MRRLRTRNLRIIYISTYISDWPIHWGTYLIISSLTRSFLVTSSTRKYGDGPYLSDRKRRWNSTISVHNTRFVEITNAFDALLTPDSGAKEKRWESDEMKRSVHRSSWWFVTADQRKISLSTRSRTKQTKQRWPRPWYRIFPFDRGSQ